MHARTVQIVVLSAVFATQTALIGLDSARIVDTFSQAAQIISLADRPGSWLELAPIGAYVWALGLLPLLTALAVGAAAAWSLRALSATPQHLAELGLPIAWLALAQLSVLSMVFWLQPPPPSSDWHNDGLTYSALLVLTGTLWIFSNPLLLWRAASGRSPQPDPEELKRLYAIALQRSRQIAREQLRRSAALPRRRHDTPRP